MKGPSPSFPVSGFQSLSKRLGNEVGLAVFLYAFEKRFDHGVLVSRLAHGAALAAMGDKAHLDQYAGHTSADENEKQRLFYA